MDIEIPENPNCEPSSQYVFQELEVPAPIRGLRISERGKDVDCDVAGVDADGRFIQAYARKIADSGAGFAYIVYGGSWGIRIRPAAAAAEPWSLENPRQWGEPFKIYGYDDILWGHGNL